MKLKFLQIIVLLVVIALVSGLSYLYGTQNSNPNTQEAPDSELTTYTSTALGFSIDIPKSVPILNRCGDPKDNSRVKVKVIEDVKEEIAYIIPEYYLEKDEKEGKNGIWEQVGPCKKIVRTLDSLQKESRRNVGIGNPFTGFTLIVDTNPEYKEGLQQDYLTKFARNIMGEKCVFVADYTMNGWPQGDYYNLESEVFPDQLPKDGPGFGEGCVVSPEMVTGLVDLDIDTNVEIKNVAALVRFHQEATFWKDSTASSAYDIDILKSFRFTN